MPPALVLTTDQPTGSIALDQETVSRRPPYLVVRVRDVRNESGTPFSVRVRLVWDGTTGGSAGIGPIVPYPPDRADDQLFDASEAFDAFVGDVADPSAHEVAVAFELAPVSTEQPLPELEVGLGPLEWYEDSDFSD